MNLARSTSVASTTESAKPYRGRRMSWTEFRKLMKEAANDNERCSMASLAQVSSEFPSDESR